MEINWYFGMFFLSWVMLRVGFVYLITHVAHSPIAEKQRIYKIPISAEQFDREKFWPMPFVVDGVGFALLAYWGVLQFAGWADLPILSQTAASFAALTLTHMFITEPLYYGYHLLLHRIPTLRQHHIKHHKATVPSPPSGYTFTLFERVSYLVLFALTVLIVGWVGLLTPLGFFAYYLVFDFFNSIGHCNVEFFPKWYVHSPLKWVVYSPSFHSLHHSRWEGNYSLFMPMYDWLFGTVEPESDALFICAQSGSGPQNLSRLNPQRDPASIEQVVRA